LSNTNLSRCLERHNSQRQHGYLLWKTEPTVLKGSDDDGTESFTIPSKGRPCAQRLMAIKKNILTYNTVNLFVSFTFMLPCILIDFFLNNQPDALITPILFCYKILHVSGIFSAHHREFSTVHSALISFMQVSDDRFQAKLGWNCSSIPA